MKMHGKISDHESDEKRFWKVLLCVTTSEFGVGASRIRIYALLFIHSGNQIHWVTSLRIGPSSGKWGP